MHLKGTFTLTVCNQGIQESSPFGSDCELVTIAFEVLGTCAFKLKIEILDQGSKNEVHFGPGKTEESDVSMLTIIADTEKFNSLHA